MVSQDLFAPKSILLLLPPSSNHCGIDDFRYFGLEFLNRCVDHSEGLSHRFLHFSVLLFFYIMDFCMPMRESKLSYILMMLPSLRTKSDSRHYIYYLHYASLHLYILLSPSFSLIKFSMINFL
jgi:hypothetical protein